MAVTTVNISFQRELLEEIDAVAQREARSRSELLREAARAYVDRQRRWDAVFRIGDEVARRGNLGEDDLNAEIAAARSQRRARR